MSEIRILINATHSEELRIAIIDGDKLDDLNIQYVGVEEKKANIYKGKITRVEPSLGAAFVDIGSDRHGFLPLKEIDQSYFTKEQKPTDPLLRPNMKDLIKEGQEVVVQVEKEERGTKGAALTTFISIPGVFLVYMPNNPRAGGISRRIEGEDREELRGILNQLTIPDGSGVIIRTAGVGKSKEELQWDLDSLLHYWQVVQDASKDRPAPFLIHREGDIVIRAVRDYLRPNITEIWADTPEVYAKVKNYLQLVRPDFADLVKLYQQKTSLFSSFKIEKQIETAFQRVVNLPSGGAIVIDHTEALVSIDVNSARSTGGRNIEETAFHTNVEAAAEIARQLRIRDIGGLIVIDFIDMLSMQNQRDVTNRLRDALSNDRARVRIGNITKFGLMEMSRQRIRSPFAEAIQIPCPRCDGQGTIRSTKSLALSIIRLIEEEANDFRTAQIQVHVPIDLAAYITNEKRFTISELEQRYEIRILIIPNPHQQTPKYRFRVIKKHEIVKGEREIESHKLIEAPKMEIPIAEAIAPPKIKFEEPAVTQVLPQTPVPASKKKGGLIKSIIDLISKPKAAAEPAAEKPKTTESYQRRPYQPYRGPNRRPSSYNRYSNYKKRPPTSSGQQS